MRTRRMTTAGVALAAALTLTACGSSPSGSTAKTGGTQSGNSTTATAFTPLTKANFGTTLASTVSGVKTAHMAITSSIMTGTADMNYGPPIAMKMSMNVTQAGKSIQMQLRLVGTVMYMQIPGMTPTGKFISMDMSKVPQASAIFKQLEQYQSFGPQSMAKQFEAGLSNLTYVGAETINGQQTRHYTVTVDTAAALKAMGQSGAALNSYVAQNKTLTEQVYLDSQQRPVRMSMALPAPIGTMQMDFSNWGQPVTISAPPAADVQQMPSGALGG